VYRTTHLVWCFQDIFPGIGSRKRLFSSHSTMSDISMTPIAASLESPVVAARQQSPATSAPLHDSDGAWSEPDDDWSADEDRQESPRSPQTTATFIPAAQNPVIVAASEQDRWEDENADDDVDDDDWDAVETSAPAPVARAHAPPVTHLAVETSAESSPLPPSVRGGLVLGGGVKKPTLSVSTKPSALPVTPAAPVATSQRLDTPAKVSVPEEAPEPDFFADMAPTIKTTTLASEPAQTSNPVSAASGEVADSTRATVSAALVAGAVATGGGAGWDDDWDEDVEDF
jgi:hypothetical protein